MTDLREQIQQSFQGRVCLMGVGNVGCGDDGFGVRLAEALAAKFEIRNSKFEGNSKSETGNQLADGLDSDFELRDSFGFRASSFGFNILLAGTNPERFIGGIADAGFDHLIFFDAVEFGGAPGSVVFLNAKQMANRFPQISTHKISLGMLAKWAESNGTTRAWLLGVQPESLKQGVPLTPTVQRTLGMLAAMLTELAQEKRASALECGGPPPLSREARRKSADHTCAAKRNALVQKRQRAGALQDAIALSGDIGCCAPAQSTIGNRQSTIPC